jgi:hypothetical protein
MYCMYYNSKRQCRTLKLTHWGGEYCADTKNTYIKKSNKLENNNTLNLLKLGMFKIHTHISYNKERILLSLFIERVVHTFSVAKCLKGTGVRKYAKRF